MRGPAGNGSLSIFESARVVVSPKVRPPFFYMVWVVSMAFIASFLADPVGEGEKQKLMTGAPHQVSIIHQLQRTSPSSSGGQKIGSVTGAPF